MPGSGPRERGRVFGPSVGEDVDREIHAHLDLRAQELMDEGWSPEQAAREAERRFGNLEEVARSCRAITERQIRAERRTGMWDAFVQDLRYGLRTLFRTPEFTLVAVLTLGLGIGANTAIYSVVDSVLLNPLPYEEPDDILWVRERNTSGNPMRVAWANFVDWRAEQGSFSSLAAYNDGTTTILGGEQPLVGRVSRVTDGLWGVFRVRALRGRLTTPADHQPGAEPVGVVSEQFWSAELGGADLDDLFLEVNGTRLRIVGVAGDGFRFPGETDLWIPVDEDAQSMYRSSHNWEVVGRLAPGGGAGAATEEMHALTMRLVESSEEYPSEYLATGVVVRSLHEHLVGASRRPLLLLLGAAGLVLLVACTNLASTLLARGATRSRELAVRASLGAPRHRIVRQLLTESMLLAGAGTFVGLGIAYLVLDGLRALGPEAIPRLSEVGMDGTVLGYAVAIAGLTVLVFGLLPARRLSRAEAGEALREGGRGNAAARGASIWRFLVAGEVALALVLLVASGLVVRSFQQLLREDAGFHAEDVTAMTMSLSQGKYGSPAEHAAWHRAFIQEARALPGVSAAGFISSIPLGGSFPSGRMELDGDLEKLADAGYVITDAGAFEALDVPLLRGRLFDESDGPDGVHVAVVSQSFADRYWPGEDPIGKTVTGGGMDDLYEDRPFSEVVGVVGDVRYRGLDREPVPTVYFHYLQRPFRAQYSAYVLVESEGVDPGVLTAPLRSNLQRLDPDVPPRIEPLRETVRASVGSERFMVILLGGFAALALVLAGAGIYGVVSYQVAQRTREMGIRLALGGAPAAVRRMVVGQSLAVVGIGLAAGIVGVLAGGRIVQALLYGVEPSDPVSLAGSALLLGGAAWLASWVPAARGTRVDPMITMRTE
jgi:predicted permease